MTERRQIARREPIEVELADGRVFIARPLPWMVANDFGQEVLRQNTDSANDFIQMYVTDAGLPQLEMKFQQKINDWKSVLSIVYPDVPEDYWNTPSWPSGEECAELALVACEVNHLGQLKHLIDPNSQTPMNLGGIVSSGMEQTPPGEKTESTPDSASVGSPELTPLS